MPQNFYDKVYTIVQQIPKGKVATYGQIALLAGSPRASRAVGEAMRRCPYEEVPCHRVVNRKGELAPAPAFRVPGEQGRRLEREGIQLESDGRVNLRIYQWQGISPDQEKSQ